MTDDANDEDKIPLIENASNGELERSRSLPERLWRWSPAPCIPARYTLAVLSFLGLMNVYALRINLSVAIVEMVNSTAVTHRAPAFNWSDALTGQVLAAFFYGYLVTQIPSGWLAEKIGGKWVFGVGVVMTSILNLFIPIVASTSVWLLIPLRVLVGFFEGATFPAIQSMWGQWAPPAERSILGTITYSGPFVGYAVSFPLSSVLATYGFDGGWPSVFYVFGIFGILWFLVWTVLAFNSPADHPRISDKERDYIESSLAAKRTTLKKSIPTPWLAILTSPAVWAIIIAHTSSNWGSYTLATLLPTYYRQAQPQINIGKGIVMSGVFLMIPYIVLTIMILVSGVIADFLRARWLSTTVVRKVFITVGFSSSATFLLLCGYFGTTTASTAVLLTVAIGMKGVLITGFSINHLDLSPRYAGVLMGLSNFFATLPGIIGPSIGKAIAKEPSAPKGTDAYLNTYKEEWRDIFIVSAEVYLFGTLIYLILGSGQQQWWADGIPRNKNKNKNKQKNKKASSEGESEPCIKETDLDAEEHIINADSTDSNGSTCKKSN